MTRLLSPDAGQQHRPAHEPLPVPSLETRVGPPSSPEGVRSETAQELRPSSGADTRPRPWSLSGFWILQLIVLSLSLIRLAVTVALHLDATSLVLELSTLALFMIPVVYAALNYGFVGALFTAAWISLLAIPRFVSFLHARDYVGAWAELMQVVLLDGMAFLIGQRVSAEREALRLVEAAREAHLRAEAMYRDLFDSNQAPILIVDTDGMVVETNAAAQLAFGISGRESSAADSVRLVDMIGPDAAARILTQLITWRMPPDGDVSGTPTDERIEPLAFDIGPDQMLFRPTATMLSPNRLGERMQVVFEDVTAETRRHDLMEAYATRVVLGQEEERRHLAQELHDGPLQTLIHLCRQIDEADPAPRGTAHADGPPSLRDLRTIAEETVAELRGIAKGLRPSILDDLGLVASINQLVSDAGGRQGFETTFGVTGAEKRLPPTVELALFRIAQEALSNVERHAGAHRVAVGISFETSGLRLLIRDDGCGFAPDGRSEEVRSPSLGLPGMTERAHLIAGRLVIHSEPGTGTTVDIWVPATIPSRD